MGRLVPALVCGLLLTGISHAEIPRYEYVVGLPHPDEVLIPQFDPVFGDLQTATINVHVSGQFAYELDNDYPVVAGGRWELMMATGRAYRPARRTKAPASSASAGSGNSPCSTRILIS